MKLLLITFITLAISTPSLAMDRHDLAFLQGNIDAAYGYKHPAPSAPLECTPENIRRAREMIKNLPSWVSDDLAMAQQNSRITWSEMNKFGLSRMFRGNRGNIDALATFVDVYTGHMKREIELIDAEVSKATTPEEKTLFANRRAIMKNNIDERVGYIASLRDTL